MTTLAQVTEQQANKTVTINELFEAVSPAALFGIARDTTAGLTFGYYGGLIWNGSAFATIADGTVALTGSATNYIEADSAGVVYKNTSAFTAGRTPLYVITTSSTGISAVTDYRITNPSFFGGNGNFKHVAIGSGSIATSNPALSITQTWASGSPTGQFVAIDVNVTDIDSSADSILQRWRVGSSVMASISKSGDMSVAGSMAVSGGAVSTGNTSALRLGTGGGEAIRAIYVASQANYLAVEGTAATGGVVEIRPAGVDTNISLYNTAKGAGGIGYFTSGGRQFNISHTASANRYVNVTGSNGGNPSISVAGGGELSVGTNAWTFGTANAVSPTSPNRTLTVTIGGASYYVHAKTTND